MNQDNEIHYNGYFILDCTDMDWFEFPRMMIFKDMDDAIPLKRVNTITEAREFIDRMNSGEKFDQKFDEFIK